jgi:hypothetical protein
MLKKVTKLVRKFIFSVLVLYGYNIIIAPLGLIVPINLITVGLITILGLPALFSMIAILLFIF